MKALNRIREQLKIQKERYSRTRYGKGVALAIYYSLFTLVPKCLKIVIPFLLKFVTLQYSYIIIILSTLIIVSILWNVSMMFVYKAKLSFFQQYRINPNRLWPWEDDIQKWHSILWKSIKIIAFNGIFIGGIALLIETHTMFNTVMDMDKTPTILWVLPQIYIMMLVEDFFFFTSHLLLHQPLLYKFHKFHHEYKTTVSIAGLHFHPVQFLITQTLSTLINVKVAELYGPMHISTLVIWLILRLWDAYNGHCGYIFSWAPLQILPFCTNDEFHDYHHTSNSGNYGSHFRFWDSIFGTNEGFNKYKQRLLKQQ